MKKTLKKLTAFLTSVLMCGVSLLDFPAGSFNISLPSWAADEGGGIYVCDHAYINGFCISCEAYQPAVQVSDKYDLDGDGATESVYEIGNAGQLYWFAKFVNEGNGNEESEAVLTDDISVNANVINENGELNGGSFRNWTPIANKPVCSFNGFFDGQNHEISGLYCVDLNDMPIGLFGITVGYGRSISNVKLVDSYFSGTGYSGGICGASNHDIKNCYNESTVIGKSGVGGICGMTQNNNVENCGNSGRIIGEKNIGGIYGCGDLNYSVTNCFNNGIISGESQAGEIGGITSGGSLKGCCYNSEINGLEVIGLGAEAATMDNVVGKTAAELESGEAAYLLGDAWGQNLDNGETKQDLPVLGGAKVYQIEKYSKCDKSDTPVTAYSNTDKTQVAEHIIENGFCVNCDYLQPAVLNSENQYEIGNAGQLYWFANLTNENRFGYYLKAILTSDIVVNENVLNDDMVPNEGTYRQWTPIGDRYSYEGVFDGNNHTISGLYYNDSSYCKTLGFICTAEYSEIKNLGIVDSYFFANVSTNYTGGICGNSNGDIINCFSICTIEGYGNVGGICGLFSGSYLINCYSLSSLVKGSGESGKICGKEMGPVDNCYYDSETINTRGGRTIEEFENGTVAYLLAKGGDYYPGEISWGQNLDNDEPKQKYPSLDGAKVYEVKKYSKCDKSDTPVTVYSNTDKEQVPAHVIENGFCKNCDYLQPAVLNSENQYEIGNAGQLYWFAKFTNESESNSNADAILTSDIVVNENVLNDELELNKGDYRKWTPISSSDESNYREFQGTFDGNNHTISGLYFNDTNYVGAGLISTAAESSKIMNLGIVDSYFETGAGSGAICGDSVGSIMNCFSICRVYGEMAGGICGAYSNENNSSGNYFINCYSLSKVSGIDAGTICGQSLEGIIDNCYTNEEPAIGMSDGSGWTYKKTIEEFENGTVAYLLAKGSSWHPIATPWGQNLDNDEPKQKYPSLGGAKVYQVNRYSTCDKSGTPKTVYSNYDKEIYDEHIGYEENNGFCACGEYQAAVLNENGVYEIGNAGQLYWFAGLVNGTLDGVEQNTLANAILTANITVNENLLDSLQYDEENNVSNGSDFITWTPIADWMGNRTTQYSGTFDGNNKTVSGLYFNGDSTCIGLFGSSESDGNIKNVGVVDSYFKGNDSVGGVCGNNAGTITNCYNAGNLTATESSATIGGICGYNNGGTVTNCYNTGTVTATGSVASVGGVCGCSIAPISNCYNIGTVTATSSGADISGICGYYFGPIKNCYYLADAEDENGGKTTAQFASGEVAYLLSQGCTVSEGEDAVTYSGSVWGQNLATENYPLLNGKTVYQVDSYEGCIGNPGNSTKVYSNTNAPIYVEHNYSSKGACTICGAFKNGIGERLEGYSVDLEGNIGVNFYMLLDPRVAADVNSYMQFTLPNGDTKKVYSNMTLTAEVDGETYNIFTCNIAAKEMNSEIKAQMFSSDAEGQIYSFTVADYANYIIKNSSKYSSETVALVKAMLNYGKYAKAYFDGEVLEATAEMNNVTADMLAEYKMSESGELPEEITYYGSSLLLESKTVLRHYFKVEEGVDAESYGFSEHKGMYYYYDDELFARNLVDPSWNFRFNDYTLTYGPMSYSYAVLTNQSDDKALVNLVKSLYLYGKAASDYYFADAPYGSR